MTPSIAVLVAWVAFGGTHLLLSTPEIHGQISRKLGKIGFLAVFTLSAVLTLLLLGVVQFRYGGSGTGGFDLGHHPFLRLVLTVVSFTGATLMVAGLLDYPRSAMARLALRFRKTDADSEPLPEPEGLFTVTRHPFFAGLALLTAAHALLAETLASFLFFSGFVILSTVGPWLQDRKLRRRHGAVYRSYANRTSFLNVAKPGRVDVLRAAQIQWRKFLVPIGAALSLAALHTPLWLPSHGGWFAILMALAGLVAIAGQIRRAKGAHPQAVLPDLPPESTQTRRTRRLMNWFPAFRRTGGRIIHIAADETHVRVRLPLNIWTRNYVGTIFGGSMYGAVDPIYMVMLKRRLGPSVSVWDKQGTIKHIKPGRGALFADFMLNEEETQAIRADLLKNGKTQRTYDIDLVSADRKICARVSKTIHMRSKR